MLISLKDIYLSFGPKKIFRGLNLAVEENDKVCLIGRNGCGKSTLFRLITKELTPDEGEIQSKKNLNVSILEQSIIHDLNLSVFEFVKKGLKNQQKLLDRFSELAHEPTDNKLAQRELEELQHFIESTCGWDLDLNVKKILSELDLPSEHTFNELSGGWQRRVGLAQTLVSKPDLLLLDEPTNHLDLATIEWLEKRINKFTGSVIFITHDRNFLQNIAGRILEIDRGEIYEYPGEYEDHLKLKSEALSTEKSQKKLFDKRLAEEEVWMSQGVKARRTRNEGRVRALEQMREERSKRVNRPRDLKIQISEGIATGKKVVDLESVYHRFDKTNDNKENHDNWLIKKFDLKIKRGEKIVLVGNNGVGKSTLLKIITGQIEPESGTVKFGANLAPLYYDQTQRDLQLDQSIAFNICEGKTYIEMNRSSIHVVGYLKNFLFDPDRSGEKVGILSGGEKNRVLLAKLFAHPSNLLVLDEPTNDLDLEMIEALELALKNYQGTIIMVSHDRYFIDRVATSCLIFESDNVIRKYFGGYSDWLTLGKSLKVGESMLKNHKPVELISNPANTSLDSKTKNQTQTITGNEAKNEINSNKPSLNKAEKKELRELLVRIEKLEVEIENINQQISAPDFHQQDFGKQKAIYDELEIIQKQLEISMARWSELDR